MRRLKKKLIIFAALCLLISGGCGVGTAARNLKVYPIPIQPELTSMTQDETQRIIMEASDFSSLTEYVIRLTGQLDKCNNQAKIFNE